MNSKGSFLQYFLFLITVFSSGCQVPPNQPLKELAEARLPESIMIHDGWGGLSPVAPIIVKYTLVQDEENFSGQVYCSVGGYFTNTYYDSEFVTIPVESVELFLKKLSDSSIEVGEYIPDITWTDDYPDINMQVEYKFKVFEFSTSSQGEKNVPRKLKIYPDTIYVINSSAPSDALQILKAFLDRNILNKLFEKAEGECSSDYFECPQ